MATVIVSPSSKYKRLNNDIYSTLELTLKEALLGCSKQVELVRGQRSINIPECVSSGTKIRIKGQGAQSVNNTIAGDHFIEVKVNMPSRLTQKQKELLEQLDF